jgi:hypothetical protein
MKFLGNYNKKPWQKPEKKYLKAVPTKSGKAITRLRMCYDRVRTNYREQVRDIGANNLFCLDMLGHLT